ncbi:MAG: 1-deoxy-D-xylulose-5-phosphate reductoisomerase [Thermodesulfobacteriota bacterium]
MKRLAVLGSTGSIGVQTLDIVRRHPDRFEVGALAAGSNVDMLESQVREFRPEVVSCGSDALARELKHRLADYPQGIWLGHSEDGLIAAATEPGVDLVIAGLPGSTGLMATFAAVEAGKDVALATKEVLVMAGALFMDAVARKGVKLLPVDSEQSAIFQCLEGHSQEIRRIMLTASGGPFHDMPAEEMAKVTRDQALDHPRWKMGPKVTVDSATLMNKGLEVIEARWLFDVPAEKIEVVIHPQSIVHSMVEFTDGSIMAQLGATDMRIPISYAMAYPDRIDSGTEPLSFPALGSLTFQEPDWSRFPLLRAAYEALQAGDSSPIVLNAADEVAVDLFLAGEIGFGEISRLVLDALHWIPPRKVESLDDVVAFHEEVMERVRRH